MVPMIGLVDMNRSAARPRIQAPQVKVRTRLAAVSALTFICIFAGATPADAGTCQSCCDTKTSDAASRGILSVPQYGRGRRNAIASGQSGSSASVGAAQVQQHPGQRADVQTGPASAAQGSQLLQAMYARMHGTLSLRDIDLAAIANRIDPQFLRTLAAEVHIGLVVRNDARESWLSDALECVARHIAAHGSITDRAVREVYLSVSGLDPNVHGFLLHVAALFGDKMVNLGPSDRDPMLRLTVASGGATKYREIAEVLATPHLSQGDIDALQLAKRNLLAGVANAEDSIDEALELPGSPLIVAELSDVSNHFEDCLRPVEALLARIRQHYPRV